MLLIHANHITRKETQKGDVVLKWEIECMILLALANPLYYVRLCLYSTMKGYARGLAFEESSLMLNGEWFYREEHELGRWMGMRMRWPMTWARIARLKMDICGQILGSNMQVELTGFADFSLGRWMNSQLRCFSCPLSPLFYFFFIFLRSFICLFIPSLFSSFFYNHSLYIFSTPSFASISILGTKLCMANLCPTNPDLFGVFILRQDLT